jgi:hypothetical protein
VVAGSGDDWDAACDRLQVLEHLNVHFALEVVCEIAAKNYQAELLVVF